MSAESIEKYKYKISIHDTHVLIFVYLVSVSEKNNARPKINKRPHRYLVSGGLRNWAPVSSRKLKCVSINGFRCTDENTANEQLSNCVAAP